MLTCMHSNGSNVRTTGGPTTPSFPLTCTHSLYSSFLITLLPSFSSLLPLPAPVQVTAHLGDGRRLPVGVTDASPLSPNPVSTWKPDLAFENAKLVVLGSCLKPWYVFKFPPVPGHERVLLQPLWSPTFSPPPIQQSTGMKKEENQVSSLF